MALQSKTKKSPSVFLFCLALFGLPAAACAWQGDYVCAALLTLVGFGCMSGFKVGAVKALALVAGIAAAIWFAPQLTGDLELKLTQWISTTGLTNRLLSLGIISVAIISCSVFVVALISGAIMKNRPSLSLFNRWVGFLMGGAEAGVGVLVLMGGLIVVQPMLPTPSSEEAPVQDVITSKVAEVIEHTERSYIGPIVEDYNPFVKFPQLNCFAHVQKTVAVLMDPNAVKQMINDPRIKTLEKEPSMQEAIGMLKSDKTINDILKSDGPTDKKKIMAIMNSPVVLHLMDQPGFLTEASNVIAEMQN